MGKGSEMEQIGDGSYRCSVCGIEVQVGANETPVTALVGQSGKRTERVVTVGSVEVHRCMFPADRSTADARRARMRTNASNLHSQIVNQAAGMVFVQADCLIEHAFLLMDARAELAGVTVEEIAEAVLDGSIHFR